VKLFSLLFLLLIFQGGFTPLIADYTPPAAADKLVNSMTDRLKVSCYVAWAKFQNHSKINDPLREAAVLSSLQTQASKIGLPASTVAWVFKPQFMASKRVQQELFDGWRAGRPMPISSPKDLQKDIRPVLDKISHDMLVELKDIQPQSFTLELKRYAVGEIHAHGFSWKVARIAAAPLGKNNPETVVH
jgi:chorismate mutase